jgi:UDP-N-acetylglucosamine transferase subunit ALG13
MKPHEHTILDKFYQLCDVLDDDISDVAIVISHLMYMAGLNLPLTAVRRDCLSVSVVNIEKYEDFIDDALDMPIKELREICDKKLANTTQLRAKIKELKEELAKYKNKSVERHYCEPKYTQPSLLDLMEM